MSPLKNNLMIIIIITCLLFKRTICYKDALVLVTENRIQFFTNRTDKPTMNVQLSTMTAAAYNPKTKDIYVSKSNMGGIWRIQITKSTMKYNDISIVSIPDWPVRGLAFDQFNSTLYYTTYGGIYYVNVPVNNTREPGVCLLGAQNPREITVDGLNRYLYWVEFSSCRTYIVRSLLDGTESVNVAKDLTDPRSLTVDIATKTLYWTDKYGGGVRKIRSMVDGDRPKLIDTEYQWSPIFIVLHGWYIYCINTLYPGELFVMSKDYPYSPEPIFEDQWKNDNPIGLFVWSGFDPKEVGKEQDSVTLVKGLSDPRSLTVDMVTKTLYWTDNYYGGVRKISSVVDGHLPELIDTKDQWSPIFIALHGRHIYCINTLYPGKLFVMSKNYPYSPKSVFEDQRKNANPIGLFVWSGFDPEEVDKK